MTVPGRPISASCVPRWTVVLVGPHGVGKTTIGRRLADALGWPFHDEIGRRLREEALRLDPDAHAFASQPGFDWEVSRLELLRDDAWVSGPGRIVESWHPTNLAYAEERSPEEAFQLAEFLLPRIGSPEVVVLPLRMSPRIAERRLSEPGPSVGALLAGFARVATRAEALSHGAGALILAGVDTSRLSIDSCVEQACAQLAASGIAAPPDGPKQDDRPDRGWKSRAARCQIRSGGGSSRIRGTSSPSVRSELPTGLPPSGASGSTESQDGVHVGAGGE